MDVMSTACHLAREDAGKEAGRRGEWAAESPALAHSSLLSAPGRRVLASRCEPGLQRRPRRRRTDGTRSGCRPRAGGRGRADIVPHFQLWFTGRSAAAARTREPSPPLHTLTSSPSSPSGLKKKKTPSRLFSGACAYSHITGSNDRRRGGPGPGPGLSKALHSGVHRRPSPALRRPLFPMTTGAGGAGPSIQFSTSHVAHIRATETEWHRNRSVATSRASCFVLMLKPAPWRQERRIRSDTVTLSLQSVSRVLLLRDQCIASCLLTLPPHPCLLYFLLRCNTAPSGDHGEGGRCCPVSSSFWTTSSSLMLRLENPDS
ncbi:uncharacterized protein LOC130515852 isoform X2 [Takifugu flavidus]|uniref:uncharacterized protein LOC130515852 isoform X2 n=1 Tax=Takifugu flavidus TaxID=433684 RepID=UPI00254411AA|nr:uncharacterized protein LOC130515852 isoform X2 [Takifugu flavidus]